MAAASINKGIILGNILALPKVNSIFLEKCFDQIIQVDYEYYLCLLLETTCHTISSNCCNSIQVYHNGPLEYTHTSITASQ